MNVKYRWKQKKLRDTVMTERCLGPQEAMVFYADARWKTFLKLKVGETQTGTFAALCRPNFTIGKLRVKTRKSHPRLRDVKEKRGH